LDSVVNGLHYFFTAEKGNPCDDLEIGLAQNVLTVDMGTGIGGGITLKTHSYSTGLTIEEPLVGHEYSKSLSVGQYQVTLLDGKNNILTERAVLVRNEGQQSVEVQGPELRLLPNPVLVGATSYLEIHGLPRDTDVSIQLSGMDGKTHYQTMLPYREGMRVPLSGTVPGLYTVSAWGGDQVWSNQINRRVLDVAIPRGATPAQVQQLEKAIELAKNKNVEILIHVVQ